MRLDFAAIQNQAEQDLIIETQSDDKVIQLLNSAASALPTAPKGMEKAKEDRRAAIFENNDDFEVFEADEPVTKPVIKTNGKVRPNDPCPCGSGKKYKKCCGKE